MAPSPSDSQLKHHAIASLFDGPRGDVRRATPVSRIWIFAFAWLTLITLLAGSASLHGISPIDARINRFSADINAAFEIPFSAIAIEPFSAVASIIVSAPDYKIAAASLFCWLFPITPSSFYWTTRRQIKNSFYIRILKACSAALTVTLGLALYWSFVVLVPLPSWSLVAKDRTTIVADLHSHTVASHDGIASRQANLAYHRARGYNLVAITEHLSDVWRSTSCPFPDGLESPEVICGVEVGVSSFGINKGFLLVLGIRPELDLPYHLLGLDEGRSLDDRMRQFISVVHSARGAVLALSYRLTPEDIDRFSEAGVDGFEVANFGHPNMSESVKSALLKAQETHRVALVASSDWHGWGGFSRTWTLFKTADAAVPGGRSEQVIEGLRNRNPDRIIPVVSQTLGSPPLLRSIFAPFIETIRYARELSPLRLASWWFWTFILFAVSRYLQRNGYEPARCLVGGLLVVLGGGLVVRGLGLVSTWSAGAPFPFPLKIGAVSCGLGIVSLLLACVVFRSAFVARLSKVAH